MGIGRSLHYFRLKNGMSIADLAHKSNIPEAEIMTYENDRQWPSDETEEVLANILGIDSYQFHSTRWNSAVFFEHGDFCKNAKLSPHQQEFIRESAEFYLGRIYSADEILGGNTLPQCAPLHAFDLNEDDAINAENLRKALDLPIAGPIDNLTDVLEKHGVLVGQLSIDNENFSGMSGTANGRPYVVVNKNMTTEDIRSTMGHEISHLYFAWPVAMSKVDIESKATSISGSFLFPEADAKELLGDHLERIKECHEQIARQYGISMLLLVKCSEEYGIITHEAAQEFYTAASKKGWNLGEPSRIPSEQPMILTDLVCKAIVDGEINTRRAAELMNCSKQQMDTIVYGENWWKYYAQI